MSLVFYGCGIVRFRLASRRVAARQDAMNRLPIGGLLIGQGGTLTDWPGIFPWRLRGLVCAGYLARHAVDSAGCRHAPLLGQIGLCSLGNDLFFTERAVPMRIQHLPVAGQSDLVFEQPMDLAESLVLAATPEECVFKR